MDYTVPKLGVKVASEELPTNCPASLAVFCYLSLAGVPFELSHEEHPSGIVPYVEYGTYTIFDNDYLIERLIENDIINLDYDCESRLEDIKKWTNSIKSLENALKVGESNLPQNYDKMYSGLESLLGSKEFFYGLRPTSLDAYFIGHALFVLYGSPVASPLRKHLREQDNLRAFVERFKMNFLLEETNWTLRQTPKKFEYYQLLYFSRNRKRLGAGSTGEVYSGCIIGAADHSSNGMMVAIKWPNNLRLGPEKKELERELAYLKVHRHENIIKLLGYIERGNSIYLMYEYMEKTSANHNFHDLDWDKTLKIALGSAAAMEYLHTRVPALIFRDFKLGNILLDKEFNPKLSDFGAVTEEGAKLCAGTYGLTDIKLMGDGIGETALDIYGMGTLLMNLLKQWLPSGSGRETITQIVRQEVERGRYIVHQNLQDSGCSAQKAKLMYNLALSCVNDDEEKRPTIQQVIQKLRDIELS